METVVDILIRAGKVVVMLGIFSFIYSAYKKDTAKKADE